MKPRVAYVEVQTIADPDLYTANEVQLMFLVARLMSAITPGTDPPRGKLVVALPPAELQ